MELDLTQKGDPYPIILHFRDPRECLRELLSDPGNAPDFVYSPRVTTDQQGRRSVSTPETAMWWIEAQVSASTCALFPPCMCWGIPPRTFRG